MNKPTITRSCQAVVRQLSALLWHCRGIDVALLALLWHCCDIVVANSFCALSAGCLAASGLLVAFQVARDDLGATGGAVHLRKR